VGRGIADQVALACKVCPSEGSRRLGFARALHFDLPVTSGAERLFAVEQDVAAWAALKRPTDTVSGGGDPGTRDQIMADTLVERLTGQQTAADITSRSAC